MSTAKLYWIGCPGCGDAWQATDRSEIGRRCLRCNTRLKAGHPKSWLQGHHGPTAQQSSAVGPCGYAVPFGPRTNPCRRRTGG